MKVAMHNLCRTFSANIFRALALLSVAALLGACGTMEDRATAETRGMSDAKLYAEAKDLLNSGNYDKAVKYFEALETRYPFGTYGQQSLIDTAFAYYKQGDQPQALATIERFIRIYPNNKGTDYMYYLRGLVNFNDRGGFLSALSRQDPTERDPKATREAFDSFKLLVERFPQSEYAADARDRLKYLVNALAEYELHVARYYYKRGAYLAAANRAQGSVKEFPQAPSNNEALQIMIDSYNAMNLPELRDDAKRVQASNYANASSADNKASWKDDGAGTGKKPWWKFW